MQLSFAGHRRRLGAVLLAAGLLGSGCGGSVAGAGGSGGSAAAETDSASPRREEAMLAFAQCMREHGVDMPDPQFQEGGRAFMKVEIDPEEKDLQEAEQACKPLMEGSVADAQDIDPERMKEIEQQMLAFAECMRGQGIDFPDPHLERGGRLQVRRSRAGADPEGHQFQEAERTCQDKLPNFPGQEVGSPVAGEQ